MPKQHRREPVHYGVDIKVPYLTQARRDVVLRAARLVMAKVNTKRLRERGLFYKWRGYYDLYQQCYMIRLDAISVKLNFTKENES